MIFLRKKADKLFLRRTVGLKRLKNEIYFVTECRKKRRKGESELRKALILLTLWRRRGDSNPRSPFCELAPLAGVCLQPLGHFSAQSERCSVRMGIL